MKALVILLILSLSLLYAVHQPVVTTVAYDVIRHITLPFKIASFIAEPPEASITLPIRNIRVSDIADTWQAPRSEGRTHDGQDIFARRGTPIFSATEGYITKIGENRLGGNIIYIVGRGSRMYYYAHLDSFAEHIEVGSFVTPQDVIGYVGDTGNAKGTPPHLHFGVYSAGGAINPLSLLQVQPNV